MTTPETVTDSTGADENTVRLLRVIKSGTTTALVFMQDQDGHAKALSVHSVTGTTSALPSSNKEYAYGHFASMNPQEYLDMARDRAALQAFCDEHLSGLSVVNDGTRMASVRRYFAVACEFRGHSWEVAMIATDERDALDKWMITTQHACMRKVHPFKIKALVKSLNKRRTHVSVVEITAQQWHDAPCDRGGNTVVMQAELANGGNN